MTLLATIKDVAAAAGVAPSTVSRVLAGSNRISPQTHEKVRAAMKELKYHPNANARSLAKKATHTIGLVMARPVEQAFANPFFPEVMRGIGSALYAQGYNLILSMAATPAEERTACLRLLRHSRVDGVILTTSRIKDRLIDDLIKEEYPFVLIGRAPEQPAASWVNNDNIAVGAMATEHLMSRGHRQIALISGPPDTLVSLDRRQGYVDALTRAGLPLRPDLEVDGGFTKEGGTRAMHELLNLSTPPTAVFCIDDAMAVGALIALKERGKSGSVAIVGVNDDPLTALTDPPLTTVRIPVFDLGATAATVLIETLTGRVTGPRQIILPSQLVVRESSNWTLG